MCKGVFWRTFANKPIKYHQAPYKRRDGFLFRSGHERGDLQKKGKSNYMKPLQSTQTEKENQTAQVRAMCPYFSEWRQVAKITGAIYQEPKGHWLGWMNSQPNVDQAKGALSVFVWMASSKRWWRWALAYSLRFVKSEYWRNANERPSLIRSYNIVWNSAITTDWSNGNNHKCIS